MISTPFADSMSWADINEQDEKREAEGTAPGVGGVPSTASSKMLVLPLPTRDVQDGVVTIVEYDLREDDGKVIKSTRKLRVVQRKHRKYHAAEKRAQAFAKFGASLDPKNDLGATLVSGDEIIVEKPHSEVDEKPDEVDETEQKKMSINCRVCGGDHYTMNCPNRGNVAAGALPPGDGAGASGSNVYRPPRGPDELDLPVVRVDNLSESAVEEDVKELFRRYGAVHRVRILKRYVKDIETGQDIRLSRGIAFVSMHKKEDAEKAVDGLNRHGYDNLILSVSMAETERERQEKKEKSDAQGFGRR